VEKASWLKFAAEKEKDIRGAMYAEKKAKVFGPLLQISLSSPAERRVLATSTNLRKELLDAGLKEDDFAKAQGIIEAFEAGKDIPANSALYGQLVRYGDARLRAMSYDQVRDLEMDFPPVIHRELMDRWGKLDKGLSVEDWLDSRTSKFIDDALAPYKLDLKNAKSPERHNQIWGDVAQDVIALRRKKGRDYFVTQGEVSGMVLRRMQGVSRSNVGDTGYLDMDPGEALAAGEVLRTRGVPMTSDKLRQVALESRKDSGKIEDAWKTWAPENENITPGQRVYIYGMASDPRTAAKYRDLHERYYAGRTVATPPFTPEILYGMIIAEKFANVDSQAAHPVVRSALESARDRGTLQTTQDQLDAESRKADVGSPAPLPGTGAEARQPGETPEEWRARNRREREARIVAETAAIEAARKQAAAEAAAKAAAEAAAKARRDAEMQKDWDERQRRDVKEPWKTRLPGEE
jgi:hypothetical protein